MKTRLRAPAVPMNPDLLLDAAERVLAHAPRAAFTTQAVAAEAGCGIGSIHRQLAAIAGEPESAGSPATREMILKLLLEREAGRIAALELPSASFASAQQRAAALINGLHDLWTPRTALIRRLSAEEAILFSAGEGPMRRSVCDCIDTMFGHQGFPSSQPQIASRLLKLIVFDLVLAAVQDLTLEPMIAKAHLRGVMREYAARHPSFRAGL